MNKAIIWIVSGKKAIDEALVSARSVKDHNPKIDTILFFDRSTMNIFNKAIDYIYTLDNRQHDFWLLDRVEYTLKAFDKLSGYDQIMILDSDTYICDDLTDAFGILEKYDIAGVHAPGRQTGPIIGDLPSSFPDIHCGMLLFNRNQQVRQLFNTWLDLFLTNWLHYGNQDQAVFREALWMTDISFYALPPEFCFRFMFGGFVRGKVKILHGRSKMSYETIEQKVNQNWQKMRVFSREVFR